MRNGLILSEDKSGLANVWLNVVKLLIGLVFAYQQILTGQLKIDLLQLKFTVLTLVPIENARGANTANPQVETTQVSQVVRKPDYRFFIPFVPMYRGTYEKGAVVIIGVLHNEDGSQIFRPENKLNIHDAEATKKFDWPAKVPGGGSIVVKDFGLPNLLAQTVDSLGRKVCLKVYYKVFLFAKDDKPLAEWPPATWSWPPSEKEDTYNNWVRLDCETPPEARPYGPLPIVQGQYCDFPIELREKSLANWDPQGRAYRKKPDGDKDFDGPHAIDIENSHGRFKATNVPYSKTSWSQNIWYIEVYDEARKEEPIEVCFVIRENKAPRPIVIGDTVDHIQLYYKFDLYAQKVALIGPWQTKEAYGYFDLDKFVVDPDGIGDPGSLRPNNIIIVGNTPGYSIIGSKAIGWRLRVPSKGLIPSITIRVSDDLAPNTHNLILDIQ